MEYKCIIGIDPGKNGGIAVYDTYVKAVKMVDDYDKISNMFIYHLNISDNKAITFIEKVQLWKSDDKGKQFGIQKMLAHYERLKSCLENCKMPYIEVPPVTWQSYLKLRIKGKKEESQDRKRRYKEIAQRKFEKQNIKVTLNTADALLIMNFGVNKCRYEPEYVEKNKIFKLNKLF